MNPLGSLSLLTSSRSVSGVASMVELTSGSLARSVPVEPSPIRGNKKILLLQQSEWQDCRPNYFFGGQIASELWKWECFAALLCSWLLGGTIAEWSKAQDAAYERENKRKKII